MSDGIIPNVNDWDMARQGINFQVQCHKLDLSNDQLKHFIELQVSVQAHNLALIREQQKTIHKLTKDNGDLSVKLYGGWK